ncbi:MAG: hypothetical protein PSV16_13530 [Flavobacterium sp.]|nr:hypothetical protein [Flavobacterium sp.]
MEKFDKTNPYNPNAKKTYSKKTLILVAVFTAAFFIVLINLVGGSSSTIGKYKKEPLPDNFKYEITADESNAAVEKNQLKVQLSEKLTVGQIATLAEQLYNSKDKQRRFYIFYTLKTSGDVGVAWAISHFDPELEIKIMGATQAEENLSKKNAGKVDGKILGMFYEEEFTSCSYTVYEKNGKFYVQTTYKDGGSNVNEMKKSDVENGIKLEDINGNTNGEYYILTKENLLEFFNKENRNFTTGYLIE